ncbi:MAG: amidohydrolase [Morganella morganii]
MMKNIFFCSGLLASCLFSGFAVGDTNTVLPPKMINRVNEIVNADNQRLTDLYKDFHQHPELAYTEVRTASVISQELKRLGFDVTEGIAKTGVVGVLKNGPGPTVWYRADMDANAVKETTGLPFASVARQTLAGGNDVDVMHACGHDAHVTWLLGMAKVMVELKGSWSGTLVLYAQPAEEPGTGARSMVSDGLWRRYFPEPDYAFAVHTVPGPVGVVASAPGVRMAGTDQLDVTFKGVGGHGSTPQMTVDPVVMAAQAVMSYQTIISRNLDPQDSAVLTVGAIEAGQDNNVIPETALLKLNLRWFDPDARNQMLRRIDDINKGIVIAAGLPASAAPIRQMKGHAGPVVNDNGLTARVNPSLAVLLGKENLISSFPAVMGSEDFQEVFDGMDVPYLYMFIGIAPPDMFKKARAQGKPFPYSNHNPDFFVDLSAIPVGVKVNTVAALSILAKEKE